MHDEPINMKMRVRETRREKDGKRKKPHRKRWERTV